MRGKPAALERMNSNPVCPLSRSGQFRTSLTANYREASALATVATCNLNQWALDFKGNAKRIKESIVLAKKAGAHYRVGPELETTGYGCEDHFLEYDTVVFGWGVIASVLADERKLTEDIVVDIGTPVIHNSVRYNCRVWMLNGKVLFIRPKMCMANDGNYHEVRWFASWKHRFHVEQFMLPESIRTLTGQRHVPFGDCYLETSDTAMGVETCEELFTVHPPHIAAGLMGVELFGNGSGSHHQLRKLNQLDLQHISLANRRSRVQFSVLLTLAQRVDLIRNATRKGGGLYLYANQQGCDGGRLYYDGSCMIFFNGALVAQGSQFSIVDVEVVTACVNLANVRTYRAAIASRREQGSERSHTPYPHVTVEWTLQRPHRRGTGPTAPVKLRTYSGEEEIALGPACWLWDYLRRSGQAGFVLPLSGGADSASVAAIVGSMCHLVVQEVQRGNIIALADVRKICQEIDFTPSNGKELAGRIFYTCYMGTTNSSEETRSRAKRLADEIGSNHYDTTINPIIEGFLKTFEAQFGVRPRYQAHGGTPEEDVALQNVQARARMVLSYLLGQLAPWVGGKKGSLLVLSSGNVDECLRGYLTKYDCSSADLNPIGSISKIDLRRFLVWAAEELGYPTLADIAGAPPTAELRPPDMEQEDEPDMGFTYEELSVIGRLRKVHQQGPLSLFVSLTREWSHLAPTVVADKVKKFFFYYGINRHKQTVLPPAYHAESYSPDDNRFDLRPFLYNSRWDWQFEAVEKLALEMEEEMGPE